MINFYRYFLALAPNPRVRSSLGDLRDGLQPQAPVFDRHLHMTLLRLAELSDRDFSIASRVDLALKDRHFYACSIWLRHLEVRANIAMAKPRGRQPELQTLRSGLEAAMLAAGMPAFWAKTFQPHVTLGRRLGFEEKRALPPIVWYADEIVLIESWHGATHHEILGRWALLPPRQRSFDFASDLDLAGRPRLDRQRMDSALKEVAECRVDCALAFDAAHAFEPA